MTETKHLHSTTDAAVWAKAFCEMYPSALCQIEGQEGVTDGEAFEHTMLCWFANAIMAGVDNAAKVKPLVWAPEGYARTPLGEYVVVNKD